MMHPEILRALVAERNDRTERQAARQRLLRSSRPLKPATRSRWQRRPGLRFLARAPVQP
jgi:hypothetical protein